MTPPRFLVYGATGYTGALVARRAAARGLPLLLAGRREAPLAALARELGAEHRAFPLEDAAALDAALSSCAAVLHCAGPFSRTWAPVAAACLRTRRHYVDVTGEPEVFSALAALDAEARHAGVLLLPGAGFDVVPGSTLAAHLVQRLPAATRVVLAVRGGGRISRGTARTVIEARPAPTLLPPGVARERTFPPGALGAREATGVALPSADVLAARHATGVADVAFYLCAPRPLRLALRGLARLAPLSPALRLRAVRDLVAGVITAGKAGPSEEERARGGSVVYGEATAEGGARAAARLRLPDPYDLTALAMVAVAERIAAGDAPPGFHSPPSAYGPDLLLGLPGVAREELA